MILKLAWRSLSTRPLRSTVLAIGFGLGIGVMSELLGVGEVILEQAHAPALLGGGDLVVTGAAGAVDSARFILTSVLGGDSFRPRVRVASPTRKANLFLIANGRTIPIPVRGGVPSREKAVGDPEVVGQASWTDTLADAAWTNPSQGDVVRAMDRFHPVPKIDAGSVNPSSWAEWLYFNGKNVEGSLRFYLTFLAGAPTGGGMRPMFVRLQLNRAGRVTNYSATSFVDAGELLAHAPDITAGSNRVRLDGSQYRLALDLIRETAGGVGGDRHRLSGDIVLDGVPGRSLPPAAIHGARGWVSGYVVPVLAGTFHGTLNVDGEPVSLEGVAGYHDHNWGFWEGVSWQWGQVAARDLSIVYGRIFPPAAVADPDRLPGFLGVLGPDGPIAFSTDVTITEEDRQGSPKAVQVVARGRQVDLTMRLDVGESVGTPMPLTQGTGTPMNFLQLAGVYHIVGKAAGRDIDVTARGSAETFRAPLSRVPESPGDRQP